MQVGWQAIWDAVTSGDMKATAAWLDAGGDIDATADTKMRCGSTFPGVTLLMNATAGGQLKIIELLIQRGANVNLQDSNGMNALVYAVVATREGGPGSVAIVRELLRAGADVQLRTEKHGYTALDFAEQFKCPQIAAMLTAAMASIGSAGSAAALRPPPAAGWMAINDAVTSGDVKATAAWLDAGSDVNATVDRMAPDGIIHTGITMLMHASSHGQLKLIELLIQRGTNVKLQDSIGMSALMNAVYATRDGGPGSPAVVRELLRAGADVQLRNVNGQTTLDLAELCKSPKEVVAMLKAAMPSIGGKARSAAAQARSMAIASEDATSKEAAQARADAAMASLLAEEEQKTKQKPLPPSDAPKSKKAKKKATKKKGGRASTVGPLAATRTDLVDDSSSEDEEAASAQSVSREAEAKATASEQAEAKVAARTLADALAEAAAKTGAEAIAKSEAEAEATKAEEEAEFERLETAKAIAQVAKADAADAAAIAAREAQEVAARAAVEEQERLRRQVTEDTAASSVQALTLADVGNLTGHNDAPESTIGGQTTCIVCMVGAKTHAAVPCGHQSVCASCADKIIKKCPYCREPVLMWMPVRVV